MSNNIVATYQQLYKQVQTKNSEKYQLIAKKEHLEGVIGSYLIKHQVKSIEELELKKDALERKLQDQTAQMSAYLNPQLHKLSKLENQSINYPNMPSSDV